MARKVVNVESLRNYANRQLERIDLSQDAKCSICLMLEEVLWQSRTYTGFVYAGWVNGGHRRWLDDGGHINNTPTDAYIGNKYDRIYLPTRQAQLKGDSK